MIVKTVINGLEEQLVRPLTRGVASATYNLINEWIQKLLENNLRPHEKAESQILGNKSLSPQGQTDAVRALATDHTLPGLRWLVNVIDGLTEKDEGFRKRFFSVEVDIKDPLLRFMMLREIRDRELSGLDQNGLNSRFLRAALANETMIMAAMLEAPGRELVTSENKTRALLERAERVQPQVYKSFEQNGILLEWMSMIRDWCARWLLALGVNAKDLDSALKVNLTAFVKEGDASFRTKMEADLREQMGERSSWPENQQQAERRTKNEERAHEQSGHAASELVGKVGLGTVSA